MAFDEQIKAQIKVEDNGSAAVKNLEKNLAELSKSLAGVTEAFNKNATANKQTVSIFKNIGGALISVNQGLELAKKAANTLIAPFQSVVSEGMAFTTQMSKVKSISNITAEEFNALSEEAKRIGETTSLTATQAAQGMEELTRAGFNAAQTISITADAMDLAVGQAADLADTARLVGIAFKLFSDQGLNSKDIVNDFNKSIGSSAQNISDFTEAFKMSASAAAAFKQPLDELSKTIALLADVGIRGTLAGTAFQAGIRRLADQTPEGKKVLDDLKLSLEDVNPATNRLTDIFVKLNKAGLTNVQSFKLFGAEAGGKFIKVIQDINKLLPEYENKLKNAKTAQQSAADLLDNLAGDITLFQSALSGLKLIIFNELEEQLRSTAQASSMFLKGIIQFVKENKTLIGEIINDLSSFGELLAIMAIGAVKGLGYILIGFGKIADAGKWVGEVVGEFIGDIITGFLKITLTIDEWSLLARRAFEDFINNTLKGISDFIDNSIAFFQKLWEDIKKIPENLSSLFSDFVDNLFKIFSGIGKRLSRDFDELIDAVPGLRAAMNIVSKSFDQAADAGNGLSMALTGNSVVPDLKDTKNIAIKAGRALLKTADGLELAFNKARNFDGKLQKTNNELAKTQQLAQKGINVEVNVPQKGLLDRILGSKAIEGIGLEFGKQIMQSIPGIGGAIEGFKTGGPWGAVAGFASDILMKTESMRETMKIISEALIELFEPIGRILIPIAKFIARIIRKIAPFIEKIAIIIGKIINAFLPILEAVFDAIIPILDAWIEMMMPIWELIADTIVEIVEILKPIIDELKPILVPILKAVGDFIKAIMPLLKLALGNLVLYAKLIAFTVKFWVNLFNELMNFLRNGFQMFENVFKNGFNLIKSILNPIKDAINFIKSLIEKIIDAIEGLGGGLAEGAGGIVPGIENIIRIVPGLGGTSFKRPEKGPITGIPGSPFQQGSTGLTRDQLFRLPGMEAGSGLIKAHQGEQIIPANQVGQQGNTFIFNIKALDPMRQKEEIRQVLESLFLEGKLRVS